MKPAGRKHIPLRRCIACHQQQAKRDLIRLVRTASGQLAVDPRGKSPGRGAYICRRQDCWQNGLSSSVLERALKCRVGAEELEALKAEAASFVESDSRRQADAMPLIDAGGDLAVEQGHGARGLDG